MGIFSKKQKNKNDRRKFSGRNTSLLRIECPALTLSAALMRKQPLNSNFIANSPFHHLQQSFDRTNILRNAQRYRGGGLEFKEGGYKRKGISQKQRMDIFSKKQKNKKVNNALSIVELEQNIYKKLILKPTRGKHFFSFTTCVTPFCYFGLFGLRLELSLELHLKYFPTL